MAADLDVGPSKVKIFVLRKMSTMNGIDMFLYARTNDTVPNFYKDQIALNDTQDRVLLYTHILAAIGKMALPGFQEELLESFVSNNILMEHFRLLTKKLFRKLYKELWSSHSKQMEEFLENVQTLLMQTFKMGLLNAEGVNLVKDLCKIVATSDNPSISSMQISVDFNKNLTYILNENEAAIMNQPKREVLNEIYEIVFKRNKLKNIYIYTSNFSFIRHWKNFWSHIRRENPMTKISQSSKTFATTLRNTCVG